MTYKLSPSVSGSVFEVPSIIADKHLRLASGEQLKVLLLILSKKSKALTAADISKALKFKAEDVEDHLQYWILTGVIEECGDDEPKKFVPSNTGADTVSKAKPAAAKSAEKEIEYTRPSPEEIAVRIDEDKEIANLFAEIQVRMGRTIGYDGQCTFLLLHDRFGLPPEVIFMLTDYCVSAGKSGYHYIESVGKNWGESEIDTIEKAAAKIESLDKISSVWSKFSAAAGLNNPRPTQKQSEKFEKWLFTYRMSFDMIFLAYEITSERTLKFSLAYMDTILTGWYEQGLKTPEDVEEHEKARSDAKSASKGKAASAESASYDLGEFTQRSIQNAPKYKKKKKD